MKGVRRCKKVLCAHVTCKDNDEQLTGLRSTEKVRGSPNKPSDPPPSSSLSLKVPTLVTPLMNSIMAEIPVLNRISSISVVT